jgi:hypothetical protein
MKTLKLFNKLFTDTNTVIINSKAFKIKQDELSKQLTNVFTKRPIRTALGN